MVLDEGFAVEPDVKRVDPLIDLAGDKRLDPLPLAGLQRDEEGDDRKVAPAKKAYVMMNRIRRIISDPNGPPAQYLGEPKFRSFSPMKSPKDKSQERFPNRRRKRHEEMP